MLPVAYRPSLSHAIPALTDRKSWEAHDVSSNSGLCGSFINKHAIRKLLPLPPGQQQEVRGMNTLENISPDGAAIGDKGSLSTNPTQSHWLPDQEAKGAPSALGPGSGAPALAASLFSLAPGTGTLREPAPGPVWLGAYVSLVPSVMSGRPRPAGGRKGVCAAGASLLLTFHSCLHWQRASANVIGEPHSQ